ncbi:hypothetical protein D3C87_1207140 [compost metagenome]
MAAAHHARQLAGRPRFDIAPVRLEQRGQRGRVGQVIARLVTRRAQPLQDLRERRQRGQIAGAEIAAPGRVVVVEHRHVLAGGRLVLQRDPAAHARHDGGHALRYRRAALAPLPAFLRGEQDRLGRPAALGRGQQQRQPLSGDAAHIGTPAGFAVARGDQVDRVQAVPRQPVLVLGARNGQVQRQQRAQRRGAILRDQRIEPRERPAEHRHRAYALALQRSDQGVDMGEVALAVVGGVEGDADQRRPIGNDAGLPIPLEVILQRRERLCCARMVDAGGGRRAYGGHRDHVLRRQALHALPRRHGKGEEGGEVVHATGLPIGLRSIGGITLGCARAPRRLDALRRRPEDQHAACGGLAHAGRHRAQHRGRGESCIDDIGLREHCRVRCLGAEREGGHRLAVRGAERGLGGRQQVRVGGDDEHAHRRGGHRRRQQPQGADQAAQQRKPWTQATGEGRMGNHSAGAGWHGGQHTAHRGSGWLGILPGGDASAARLSYGCLMRADHPLLRAIHAGVVFFVGWAPESGLANLTTTGNYVTKPQVVITKYGVRIAPDIACTARNPGAGGQWANNLRIRASGGNHPCGRRHMHCGDPSCTSRRIDYI